MTNPEHKFPDAKPVDAMTARSIGAHGIIFSDYIPTGRYIGEARGEKDVVFIDSGIIPCNKTATVLNRGETDAVDPDDEHNPTAPTPLKRKNSGKRKRMRVAFAKADAINPTFNQASDVRY